MKNKKDVLMVSTGKARCSPLSSITGITYWPVIAHKSLTLSAASAECLCCRVRDSDAHVLVVTICDGVGYANNQGQ